ncbi:MAG: hypothetical protein V1816_03015 [Pseudomonadota bacterium]
MKIKPRPAPSRHSLGRVGLRLFLLVLLPGLAVFPACSQLLKYSAVETFAREQNVAAARLQPPTPRDYQDRPAAAIDWALADLDHSGDPLLRDLGRSLAKLPDLNHEPTPAAALAVEKIRLAARGADEDQRSTLWRLAVENDSRYQFSGSLQGLLWLVEDGRFDPNMLSESDRSDFLDQAWRRLPARLTSPQKILDFMTANFSYILNSSTAEPLESFFRDKYGDCTEFCLLEGYLLEKLGYKTWVLICAPNDIMAHAAIIYQEPEGYRLMDGSRVAMRNILKRKMDRGDVTLFDQAVWNHMRPFDRIFGPSRKVGDLIKVYEKLKKGKVPYKLVPYSEYKEFIQTWRMENPEWFYFK